ncbi:MAG TPA: hypothetical protein DCS97_09590 [Planctomycetes bacterium]|nr:hypothetical protein [Planctomycetota bacterium]
MIRPIWRFALAGLLGLPVIGLGLAALAPTGWYPADLAQHWAPHLAILSLPLWCWLGRRAWIGGGLALLAGAALWPWLWVAWAPRALPPGPSAVRVTTANVYYHSIQHRAAILPLEGDIVALIETRPEDRTLVRDDPRWPHQRWLQALNFGAMGLLSRWPMQANELDLLDAPGIDARIAMPWGSLRVIAVHTWSPSSRRHASLNRLQLTELAGIAETEPGPLLILGDLNATPGEAEMRRLHACGLRLAHGGSPRTWPSWLGPAGIAIDHILVRGLRLGDAQAVDLPGSDHHGVTALISP